MWQQREKVTQFNANFKKAKKWQGNDSITRGDSACDKTTENPFIGK